MTTIEAVYQQGVLQLLEPIALPEGARVLVTVVTAESLAQERAPADILAAIAALSGPSVVEESSSRDHDQVLYDETGTQ